ncbi:MAG TPA: histidine phosphatase family protein [Pyrinomonadaceae bacterium]
MKILFLLRHAKSSWDDASLADFDRPLNARGKSAAPFMGEVMAGREYLPAVIVSSPANRAATTAKMVKDAAGLSGEIRFDDRIYEASPNTIRQVISELHDTIDSAMVVGHNPGMEDVIRYLTGEVESMPTAALAVIQLNIDSWTEINADSGELVEIICPKDELKAQGTA